MNILLALRREERKLQKRISKVQANLAGIQAAMKVLSGRNSTRPKLRLSAAARARISREQKARWAKARAAK